MGVQEIKYSNVNSSTTYNSIDETLCILGAKEKFRMLTRGYIDLYAYDFQNIGMAVVFVSKESCSNKTGSKDAQDQVTVHLLGFKPDSFYKKVHDALIELQDSNHH